MTGRSLGTADAESRAAYRRELRRCALPWSIGMLLVSWPIPLLTGLLLYRLGGLLAPWAAFTLPALWLVSGLLFLPLFNSAPKVIEPDRSVHPAMPRRPTAAEAAVLDPAWNHTMRAIGLEKSKFSVCVRDSPGPLGSAHPGGVVIVSAEAVRESSPAELRGLLGHEIGHLVGDGGGAWYRMSWWYGRLLRMLFAVVGWGARRVPGRWLPLAVMAAAQFGVLVGMVALLCLLFGTIAAVALPAAAAMQVLGQRTVLRRNQFNADRVSVDLGAGPGLRSLIRQSARPVDLRPRPHRPVWLHMTLLLIDALSRDPSLYRRVAAMEARMREQRSGRPEPPDLRWVDRARIVILRPMRRLLLWTMTAPSLNPFAGKQIRRRGRSPGV